jgi:putative sigma-54 modulation protein
MVQVTIKGKNLEITESLRSLVEDKFGRLDKYSDDLTEIRVELTHERTKAAVDRNHIDAMLMASGSQILRAEARGIDMRAAIDTLFETVQGQLLRHKERLHDRSRASAAKTAGEIVSGEMRRANPLDMPDHVILTEPIEVKPMSVAEAVDEMRLSGDDILVFVNSDSDQVNVLRMADQRHFTIYVPEGRVGSPTRSTRLTSSG